MPSKKPGDTRLNGADLARNEAPIVRSLRPVLLALVVFVLPAGAHAQSVLGPVPLTGTNTNGGQPRVTWLSFGTTGDTRSDQQGEADALDDAATVPLRLSLTNEFGPRPSSGAACSDSASALEAAAGMPGFPTLQAAGLRIIGSAPSSLIRMRGPRLTLFGMSRFGCARDAYVGGGITFTVPIRERVSFVLSGGAIYLPNRGPNDTPMMTTEMRAGMMFTGDGGRSYSVGLAVAGRSDMYGSSRVPGVSFSGNF